MRHPLPFFSARAKWRMAALLIIVLALCVFGAIYGGGEAETAAQLGPGWTCKTNVLGTVCLSDAAKTMAKR